MKVPLLGRVGSIEKPCRRASLGWNAMIVEALEAHLSEDTKHEL
jgi:hypothetical protein